MTYLEFLDILRPYAEEKFADFQRKLIFTDRKILGVRTPTMRKIAKEYGKDFKTIFDFPNEYYEVVFIKLAMVSALPYEQFVRCVKQCVALMDCWALCDSFKVKCIKKHKAEFLRELEEIFLCGGEYDERYPLVVILSEYMEKEDLYIAENYLIRADTSRYYVSMAAAWLLSEILIKHYDSGKGILVRRLMDNKTHNRAIQKAIDSYRLTKIQKDELRSLKIK